MIFTVVMHYAHDDETRVIVTEAHNAQEANNHGVAIMEREMEAQGYGSEWNPILVLAGNQLGKLRTAYLTMENGSVSVLDYTARTPIWERVAGRKS